MFMGVKMSLDMDVYKNFMKGTTTVGMICSDGVVIGADSKATMGTFISTIEAQKRIKIDNNLGMTIAGSVGDANELARIIKAQNEIYKMNEGHPMSPKSATSLLSVIMQQNKMMPFYVQLIVGGMDSNGTQLYSIDPIGGYTAESKFTATGSGTESAIGYIEDVYKSGINTKEGIKIAAKALSIAMRRDSATGGSRNIVVISKNGYMEYGEKDIEKVFASK